MVPKETEFKQSQLLSVFFSFPPDLGSRKRSSASSYATTPLGPAAMTVENRSRVSRGSVSLLG
jgi:hypothetical protein